MPWQRPHHQQPAGRRTNHGMVQVGVTPTDSGRELLESPLQPVRSGFRLKAGLQQESSCGHPGPGSPSITRPQAPVRCHLELPSIEPSQNAGMVQVGVTPTDSGRELLEFRLQPVRSGFRLKAAIFGGRFI